MSGNNERALTDIWQRDLTGGDIPHAAGRAPEHMDEADAETLWRDLCGAEYRSYLVGYGNDGDPRNDHSPARHNERAASLAGRLSQQVSIPPQELRGRASDAAYLHGQDPGTDDDPDRFATPIWADWAADEAQDQGWAW